MCIRNNLTKQIYRMFYLFFCLSGIILQYANSAMTGGNSVLMLSAYYTMITNIICFVYFAYLVVVTPKHENPTLKGAIVMSIFLTGVGYHILLSNFAPGAMEGTSTPFFAYSNLMVHTITPLGAYIDYLLFTEKGEFKWYDPFYWMIIPAVYCIFIFIRAALSSNLFNGFGAEPSRFPYPFLDADLYGVGNICLFIFVLVLIYTAFCYMTFGLDKLLKHLDNKIIEKYNNIEK